MMQWFSADLHVHTCLSPCAGLDMGPRSIVGAAKRRGLDVIGISDHNSTENSPAVVRAAIGHDLTVLPGMEVTSREEVHILALFDNVDRALRLQQIVYDNLPGRNNPDVFGMQVVVDEEHTVLGFNDRLLAGATQLPLEEVVDSIHRLDGLAIAAHIDRESFGIIGQLGFIPADLDLDALELSPHITLQEARRRFPECASRPFVRSSDAHSLEQVGNGRTAFLLGEATLDEIRKAFQGKEGRSVSA
jgi:hypothetical protein